MRQWLGEGFRYRPQGQGDLGARMEACFSTAFEEGAARAVLIGTDIPDLSPAIVIQAFDALACHDLVFGPAADGGYYLVGAAAAGFQTSRVYLGQGIPWGSSDVLACTLAKVRAARLSYQMLETLADMDRPEDLAGAMRALGRRRSPPAISVVIPALNEAGQLESTLPALASNRGLEVIVVDGGSRDATVAIAGAAGVRSLPARPPRAIQMNAGAAAAAGDILLFLHADTRLPEDFQDQIRRTLARPRVAAGAFHLQIDAAGKGLRIIEQAANWRSRLLQMPYGDQALFLRRDAFWESGAFPPIAIMEDFAFTLRLRRRGRIVLAPGRAVTSARRWQRIGPLKTWVVNQRVLIGYFMGIAPERLARWYRREKAR
jgi:rSAM/selenodomain-associated transferase 2/rSAM/selenodomain-associated transferase 1